MWAGSGRVLLVVVLAVALAGVPVAHAQAAVTTSTGALTTAGGRAGPHRPGRGPEQHPGLGQPDRG